MSNALSNLDQNRWYHIRNANNPYQYIVGTYLVISNSTIGAVFNQNIKDNSPEQIWQFFPVDNGSYILRTLAGGQHGFLSTAYSTNETWIGQTIPRLLNSSALPDSDQNPERSSIYWSADFFDDGFVYFHNRANGSEWRLSTKTNAIGVMDRNLTGPPAQRFNITPASMINDRRFSSVVLPTAGGEATATGTPDSDSDSNSNSNSGGLSTGAQAGIGAGIGVAALMAIILGVWFFLRRRKQKKQQEQMAVPQHDEYEQGGAVRYKKTAHMHEAGTEGAYAELQGGRNEFATELPAGSVEGGRNVKEKLVELPGESAK